MSQQDLSQGSTSLDVSYERKHFAIVGFSCLCSPLAVELKRLYQGERIFFFVLFFLMFDLVCN